jgi:hypothetical protein
VTDEHDPLGRAMSKPRHQDPDKRAAKAERRKRRKTHIAAGQEMLPPQQKRRSGLTDHGTSPRKQRHRREGEARHHRDRGDA